MPTKSLKGSAPVVDQLDELLELDFHDTMEHSVLITTVVIGESNAVSTTVVDFLTLGAAQEAIFQVNNHQDEQGRYEQTAIALFRV